MTEPYGWNGIPDLRSRIAAIEPMRKGQVTLDASGVATITFEALDSEPRIIAQAINSTGDPVIIETNTKAESGGEWTGATLQGYRIVPLPQTTLQNVISLLSLFRVAQADSLSGVKVDWIAT